MIGIALQEHAKDCSGNRHARLPDCLESLREDSQSVVWQSKKSLAGFWQGPLSAESSKRVFAHAQESHSDYRTWAICVMFTGLAFPGPITR